MLVMLLMFLAQDPNRPAHIIDDGWTYRGSSEGYRTLHFTRRGPTANKLWSRYETNEPVRGIRSVRQLDEMNCETGQYRTLQQTAFPEPNLLGEATELNMAQTWSYPGPGTLSELSYQLVCGA